MIIKTFSDKKELYQEAVTIFQKQLQQKSNSVLGLATGKTPIPLYQGLVQAYQQKQIDFSHSITFNLDEYAGLPQSHPMSYRYFMRQQLFDFVNLPLENIHIPDGMNPDLEEECLLYETTLEKYWPIDLQLLGIGYNGHIGFNEPGTNFTSTTHSTPLSASTRTANARFFSSSEEVPHYAVTMGIGSILKAKSILLIVTGSSKANILYQACKGPVTEKIPASALQLHPHVTVLTDIVDFIL